MDSSPSKETQPAQQNQQQAPVAKPGMEKKVTRSDYDIAYEHDRTKKKVFKLRVVYNRKGCIGSSHCILSDPYNFELDEEMRAVLKEGTPVPNAPGTFVKIIETDAPHLILNAAKTCTPKVISVIDIETGKRIAP